MNKYLNICLALIISSIINGCGGEDWSSSSTVETETEKAPVNTKAIVFPELPTTNTPSPVNDIDSL